MVDSSSGDEVPRGFKLRHTLRGDQAAITRLAWSPDGRMLASGAGDSAVRIWDAETGEAQRTVIGQSDIVYSVAWSPDGRMLASGAGDHTICLWRPETGVLSCTLQGHDDRVFRVAWSPVGQTLASGSADNSIRLWDAKTGELRRMHRGHYAGVNDLAWSPDGRRLASGSYDQWVRMWSVEEGVLGWKQLLWQNKGHTAFVSSLAWSPDGRMLASSADDSIIQIWDPDSGRPMFRLEGHAGSITGVAFSADSRLLASKSKDNTVHLWRTDRWETVAILPEEHSTWWGSSLAFHPDPEKPVLATLGERDTIVRIWDLDLEVLLCETSAAGKPTRAVYHTTAKVVLVGEAGVGKSCLASRVAENRYPKDHEQGTTHGMRFWPMDAEKLHPSARPPADQRRDIVLWDMGGQDEYRLVHQLFLHDTTLALILIDPTRGRVAHDEAREWNKRLVKQLEGRNATKLLVGAKMDQASELANQAAIDKLCLECGFRVYLEVSAKTSRNVDKLRQTIAASLDWDRLAKTSRPELFQRIRDHVEERRKRGELVVLLEGIKTAIKEAHSKIYEETAVEAVVEQLATQGVIVQTRLAGREKAVVLQLPVIERYAGSLIVAARNNPRGVPVLEERLLGSPEIPLPGMSREDRLKDRFQERIVLECIAELMIQHGIGFRHEGLLVFPTLFPSEDRSPDEVIHHSISLYYDFTGAIDNIYASLVARLVISQMFGEGRLWPGRVEFDSPGHGVCGIRQVKRTGGLAHADLFFAEETRKDRRELFTRFVEDHLRLHGVEIREHQAMTCRACKKMIAEDIVRENIERDQKDVLCPYCRTITLISEGVARTRERDPESDHCIYALRTEVDRLMAEDAEKAKQAVARDPAIAAANSQPIRLLHLSDLHFTAETSFEAKLVWLLQDLRKGEFLGIETVEYLVISGDFTDRGSEEGFESARQFVSLLIRKLGLSPLRCILVPGNHDVQDLESSYDWKPSVSGLEPGRYVQQGEICLVRNDANYPLRFKKFSDAFYHKVMASEPYPLDVKKQGLSYLFSDTRIQFLALNSCWQIDRFYRKRSDIHPDAVSHAISRADRELEDAIKRGELNDERVLRFGVWHHAASGPEMIQNTSYLENLCKADVRICLHGDVHEMRCELIGYKRASTQIQVVGAGSFGSPTGGRPESTPRLYNLLEIRRDLRSVRVHTREQARPDGAWQGWFQWPDPDGGRGRVPYFDIDLT